MANPNVPLMINATQSVTSQSVPHDITNEYLIAGEVGDVQLLYDLMKENSGVLEQIDNTPFAETPLHRAAKGGHVSFAGEIMALKPSFSRKLSKEGLTPLHLALEEKGKVDVALQDPNIVGAQRKNCLDLQERFRNIVLGLLEFDKDLACVKGREGHTPFHYAARIGDPEVLIEILIVCPKSILDLTINGETALHIALKYKKHKASFMLYDWIYLTFSNEVFWRRYILRNQQSKANEEVLKAKEEISKIKRGQYLSKDDYNEIARMLCRDPAVGSSLFKLTEGTRNALLVVVALLVTINFQVLLTPPGGTWQEDTKSHRAGTAIMGPSSFQELRYLNVGSLCFSMWAVIFLLPRSPLSLFCVIPIGFLFGFFYISRKVQDPNPENHFEKFLKKYFFWDVGLLIIVFIGIWFYKVIHVRSQQMQTLIHLWWRRRIAN